MSTILIEPRSVAKNTQYKFNLPIIIIIITYKCNPE